LTFPRCTGLIAFGAQRTPTSCEGAMRIGPIVLLSLASSMLTADCRTAWAGSRCHRSRRPTACCTQNCCRDITYYYYLFECRPGDDVYSYYNQRYDTLQQCQQACQNSPYPCLCCKGINVAQCSQNLTQVSCPGRGCQKGGGPQAGGAEGAPYQFHLFACSPGDAYLVYRGSYPSAAACDQAGSIYPHFVCCYGTLAQCAQLLAGKPCPGYSCQPSHN
jgi:hypothetical protein